MSTFPAWGMDGTTATTLTGSTISDADLDVAEEEIVDYLGWRPDEDDYGDPDPATVATGLHDVRARAYGRAVAWQAAYRADTAAAPGDGGSTGITSESIGDYSYQREPGSVDTPHLVARARTLLARAGFTAAAWAGHTRS